MKRLHILYTTALILSFLAHTSALFGRTCTPLAKEQARGDPEVGSCSDAVCGSVPETRLKFHDRLSPQCAALMEQYRSTWSVKGLSNMMDNRPCTKDYWTAGPTGPILVSNEQPIATFAMCTIPKIACTNIRKLLSILIRYPEPLPMNSFKQYQGPHGWEYPNVFHYDVPEPEHGSNETACGDEVAADSPECSQDAPRKRLPAHIPSFVVGRNPYIRVLSGFLDKMVTDPKRYDQWSNIKENAHLGLDPETAWENSRESYASFVRHLTAAGLKNVDGHFMVSSTMCGASAGFKLDYYLRLEDMQQWFPCWMQGLGLRKFTEQGWADTIHGRMWVGLGEHWISEKEPRRRRKRPRSSLAASNAEQPLVPPPPGREQKRSDLRTFLLSKEGSALLSEALSSASAQYGAEWRNRQHRFPSRLNKLMSPRTEPTEGRAAQRRLAADDRRTEESVSSKRLVSGEQCWWSPKGMGCREYYESFTLLDGTVVPGGGGDVQGGNGGTGREQQPEHAVTRTAQQPEHAVSRTAQQPEHAVTRTAQQPEHAESDSIQQQEHAVTRTIQQQEHAEPETIQEVVAESAGSDEAQGEPPKPPKKTVGENDPHDKRAADKWEEYYDQETADLIYQLYYEDFRMFGYERLIVPEES